MWLGTSVEMPTPVASHMWRTIGSDPGCDDGAGGDREDSENSQLDFGESVTHTQNLRIFTPNLIFPFSVNLQSWLLSK